jgi:hypothetical protein
VDGDRESNGRFRKGWGGGPGRPARAVEDKYLAALSRAVTGKDIEEIVKAAVEAAKNGDGPARACVLKLVFGDDPVMLRRLAEELAELRREVLGHAVGTDHAGEGTGAAAPAAGPAVGQPDTGGAPHGPVGGVDEGGLRPGPVAEESAVLPLFAGDVAGQPPVRQEPHGGGPRRA